MWRIVVKKCDVCVTGIKKVYYLRAMCNRHGGVLWEVGGVTAVKTYCSPLGRCEGY